MFSRRAFGIAFIYCATYKRITTELNTVPHLPTQPADWSRRRFISATAMGLAAGPALARSATVTVEEGSYVHRALNGWITDFAAAPDVEAAWPSMRLDEALLEDYRQMFGLMQYLGFNEIVIWGLYTANHWPLDLAEAVPAERGKMVDRLIAAARRRGIKVLSGLGVYSWGFAEIIKANPKLSGGNPNGLCASEPESHAWMDRVCLESP